LSNAMYSVCLEHYVHCVDWFGLLL